MDQELKDRIIGLTQSNHVVLFMKGNKMFPQCGFSAHVVGMLKQLEVDFDAHNILADSELRQGLKDISEWPTYPQLYVDGKLVGGADIINALFESGELEQLVKPQGASEPA